MKRIIFMGTPEIAATILESLINSEHEVIAAVTQPDRPKGRGNQLTASPVKELAVKHNIPVLQPVKVKEEGFFEKLQAFEPQMIIVAAFGQILPKAVLEMAPFGCINVHASLLPKYRGAAPIQWAILNGETKTGVTIMHMDAGIDTGDMIVQQEVEIAPNETGESLHNKLAVAGANALMLAIEQIENGSASRIAQNHEEHTYVKILDKTFGNLDFTMPAIVLERYIRGLDPWPCAYSSWDGKNIKFWKSHVLPQTETKEKPGTVLMTTKNEIRIQTGDGILCITELQLQGKKRMSAGDFLRGNAVKQGDLFGE